MSKIILTADTACDLGPELIARYNVKRIPFHVIFGEQEYKDGVDIDADKLYAIWGETGKLPRTAALNTEDFTAFFNQHMEEGAEIVHISIGSGLSVSCQCAGVVAEEMGNVHVVDSCSLSAGIALLACVAGDRIAAGETDAAKLAADLRELALKTSATFVLDCLDFMRAGGRCSGFAQLSAALLKIKPSLKVCNDRQGTMAVGKKYNGTVARAAMRYLQDQLEGRTDIDLRHAFLTHSGMPEETLLQLKEAIQALQPFEEIHITRASCTISTHCGPGTVGVLFITK
ncbi:MAG: DegV family protein [Clostridiales bacterium]|nr:DegV family protein [Clostridiales bacterium]